jgi:hypothetical protein
LLGAAGHKRCRCRRYTIIIATEEATLTVKFTLVTSAPLIVSVCTVGLKAVSALAGCHRVKSVGQSAEAVVAAGVGRGRGIGRSAQRYRRTRSAGCRRDGSRDGIGDGVGGEVDGALVGAVDRDCSAAGVEAEAQSRRLVMMADARFMTWFFPVLGRPRDSIRDAHG